MSAWQPPEEAMDPELALALELDLLSDQELLDAAGLAWPPGLQDGGSGGRPAASATAPWPVHVPLPQLPVWPLAAGQQPFLPVVGLATAGLAPDQHVAAAAAAAGSAQAAGPTSSSAATAAAGGRAATSAATTCKPGTPRRGGKGGGGTGRYDKPGARERKQEQQVRPRAVDLDVCDHARNPINAAG